MSPSVREVGIVVPRIKSVAQQVLGATDPPNGATPYLGTRKAFNLDRHYYDGAWNPTSLDGFAALQRDMVAADRWIIEGNNASTLRSGSPAPTR